jgi:hypothetical protein
MRVGGNFARRRGAMLVPRPGRSERAPSAARSFAELPTSESTSPARKRSPSGRRKPRLARARAGHPIPRRYLPASASGRYVGRSGASAGVRSTCCPAPLRPPEHAVPAHPRRHECRPPGRIAPIAWSPDPSSYALPKRSGPGSKRAANVPNGIPSTCEIESREAQKAASQSDLASIVITRGDPPSGLSCRRSRVRVPSLRSLEVPASGPKGE